MASVWSARHQALDRDVALKLAPLDDDESATRFRREAQIIGKLDHPNIVSVLDAGQLDDERHSFLMMELLRGAPFSERLRPGAPLPPSEVLPIVIDVCRGLEAAHAAGVVHLDIKPENVFLTESGVTKLVDFGISRAIGPEHTGSLATDDAILGTPAYMSPEQALGRGVDARTDVWAVGVVLHEALTGQQPFCGAGVSAILRRVIESAPPELDGSIDPRLRQIVARCLEKAPAHRYRSIAALRAELELLAAALSAPATECTTSATAGNATTLAPRQNRQLRDGRSDRMRALILLGLAALATAVAGSGLTFGDASPRLVLRTGLVRALTTHAAPAPEVDPTPTTSILPAASPPASSEPAPPRRPDPREAARRGPTPITRVTRPGF
jgi:serine/threonine-protein kinase